MSAGSMTRTGDGGTVSYMAPEQFMGNVGSAKADVYSWAIIMCEMLMQQMPWYGLNNMAIVYEVVFKVRRRVGILREGGADWAGGRTGREGGQLGEEKTGREARMGVRQGGRGIALTAPRFAPLACWKVARLVTTCVTNG
eukprot:125329-Chlamydomonas_euryale.AAC.3